MNVFVQARDSKDARRITSITDRDIAEYFWKGNDKLLYLKDSGGDENFHLFSVSLEGLKVSDLTPFDSVQVRIIDDLVHNDTDVLISMNKRDRELFDVYRLNTSTGDLKLIAENPGNVTMWKTDHEGKVRLASVTDGVNSSILFRETDQDSFRVILTTDFRSDFQPLFFTFDNKKIYASSNLGRDKSVIVKYDIANGKEIEVLYEDPGYDVSGLNYSRQRMVLTSVEYTTWKPVRKYLDEKTEKVFAELEGYLPGYEVELTASNRNENTFICRTYNDRTPGSYYLYESNGNKITKLAERNPWLSEGEMAHMKPISYISRDGLAINGYLTVPLGKDERNLPTVVYPHGGPWSRDDWYFNPEVQLFANRGYAVFQMNFRGSTGYGKKFWEASFKQWGKAMQDDITDGVNWLIKEGIADPKRIAIYGHSYGGYASLAGAVFTPDLYTCAISYCGVTNLFTFLGTIPAYWKPLLDMFYEMIGDPIKDSSLLEANSPVFHADRIKVPLLIAQGANDPRVSITHSSQMVDTLRKRGVQVEYIVKDNEGHVFTNEENMFAFYESVEKFLARHLAP
jgi:dipeptidyl aminopeptidase/acylaminoacyl peptidase